MAPTSRFFLVFVLAAGGLAPLEFAEARGGRAGGGGASVSRSSGSRPSVSRPSSRPASTPSTRPSTSRPATSRPSTSKPSQLPATKPAPTPPSVSPPAAGGGSSLNRPSVAPPVAKPPAVTPPGVANPVAPPAAATRPITLPAGGGPGDLPGIGNRPGTLPETGVGIANRPSTLPSNPSGGGTRPVAPGRPATLPAQLPRPATLPAGGGADPGWWNQGRPDWGNQWNNVNRDQWTGFNKWKNDYRITINNFNDNRVRTWGAINARWGQAGWWRRYGSADYFRWCDDVFYYRGGRCRHIWSGCYGCHDYFFNVGWWGACWWRPGAVVRAAAATAAILSPWWWWRPVTYPVYVTFYGSTWPEEPVIYDPGTSVIIEGDVIYQDGQSMGSATEHREETIALASPEVEEFPVPEPAEEGKPETWLPLGVWALTQQEQGDAVMFFQLSSDKNGLVAGAYRNVMTGEDQPVVGRIDQKTQRIAWHIGKNTGAVYETGVASLTYDAASVFVHFGKAQTQTWLLVRLPSPEMPPGTVKLPPVSKAKGSEKK